MSGEKTVAALEVPAASLKMLRETLCRVQSAHGVWPVLPTRQDMERVQVLIDQIDKHRPLGPDGKHGDRHTANVDIPININVDIPITMIERHEQAMSDHEVTVYGEPMLASWKCGCGAKGIALSPNGAFVVAKRHVTLAALAAVFEDCDSEQEFVDWIDDNGRAHVSTYTKIKTLPIDKIVED